MNKEKVEFYRNRLIEEKKRLDGELSNVHNENISVAKSAVDGAGRDQNYDDHMADAATDLFYRERDESLEQNLVDISAQIKEALQRIDAGTYGVCARCHKPIDDARLSAIPYASLCLADKEQLEGPR